MNSIKISILAVFATCAVQPVFADGSSTGFNTIDTNLDGYISSQEAEANGKLNTQWKKLDMDNNGKLDKSEFSAFETLHEDATKASPSKPVK